MPLSSVKDGHWVSISGFLSYVYMIAQRKEENIYMSPIFKNELSMVYKHTMCFILENVI